MASIEQKLKPFTVPNFVAIETTVAYSRTDGPPSVPVADLPTETLDELCEEFRAAVFAKAGKRDPRPRAEAAPLTP